jgi:hypothetical protein
MKNFVGSFYLLVFLFGQSLLFATEKNPPDISDSWLNETIEHIQKEEYKPSLQESDYKGESFEVPKYHFANRACNLRAYFDEDAVELIPRVITSDENWNLKIKAITVDDRDKSNSGNLEFAIDGDNIRCEGDGIEIIYSNSESGVWQNIIITEKNEIKKIDFIVETENLYISQENDGFILNSNEDEIIYRIQKFENANGEEISHSLSNENGKLSISINGTNIIYPIKITASITSNNPSDKGLNLTTSAKSTGLSGSPNWTAQSNQDGARLGCCVSPAGDVNGDGYSDLIVGAYYYDGGQTNEGAVFVYHGSQSGLPLTSNWSAESDQANAYFGYSVSSAGDVNGDGYSDVIVGAYTYDHGETDEGRAFVYHGSSSGLSATADWTAESEQQFASFGYSVSLAGDVNGDGYSDVIVGAYHYDDGEIDEGAAFVYHGSSTGLSATNNWIQGADQDSAHFGFSVSGAGDVNGDGYSDVIVGAYRYNDGETNEGAAFVYHGSSSGLSATADWSAESDQANAYFGYSVSSAGDVYGNGYSDVIVGAVGYDNVESNEGRAFLYRGSSSGLTSSPYWTAESDKVSARFGCSVSSAGDVNGDGYSDVIVGADFYNNGESEEGAAFVYLGSYSSGLDSNAAWTVEANQTYARFGHSVSSAGDVNGDGYSDVIVGAYTYDDGETDEGKVFLYYGDPSGLSDSAYRTKERNQAGAGFGCSVSSAGDVNGDGYSDVIVGAYAYDNGQSNEGRAFLYSGRTGITTWTAESNQENAFFGSSVSGAGDVNNDGYSDVIVGVYRYDDGETEEGAAFGYYGGFHGLSDSADWSAESDQDSAYFGTSVSSAGDVNGDGYSDVIVGANRYENGESEEGAAFVYHGSPSGLSATPNWTAESDQADASFGSSVSSAGDVNGDGYSDVIVGAIGYENGEEYEGAVFVYHGSSSGLSATSDWSAESNLYAAHLGNSVSSAGDVNGDGYSDVIVGAFTYSNGESQEGAAFAYHGSSSGLSATYGWSAEPDQIHVWFGYSVSSAGDVNGDGYSDVIVGGRMYDNGEADEGAAFVYHGSSSGLSLAPDWSAESNQEDSEFGISVSTAGDINGDGYSDVIVGASYYDNGEDNEGAIFVYLGNGRGVGLVPTQSTLDGSRLVQLGNASGDGSVKLNMIGLTPAGRGKVKMQWEVKELGQLFNGLSLSESASWYDTDVSGIEISEDVIGLSYTTPYHWRIRLKYDPVIYVDAVHSRWLSIGPNGWNEADFITSDMSGIKYNEDVIPDLQFCVFPSISTNIFSISFYVSKEEAKEDINLKVYNKAGIMVKNLFTGKKPTGTHTIKWNGNNSLDKALPNDVYFISLKKGKEENLVRKIVLLR